MGNPLIDTFVRGALWLACWVASLFFWRYWRATRDRLFVFFSLAFLVLGLHWLAVGLALLPDAPRHEVYLLRLVAFLLIAVGIVDKNRRAK